MTAESAPIPLIRTKLHRPPIQGDMVPRPQLLERLDQRRQRPLTLVSAPAGYGKSTLVSHWLETANIPSAWVSLDENDNDIRRFLSYFLAAVQTAFPDIGNETLAMLNATDLPPVSIVTRSLINELDQIDNAFILALDDYHIIREGDILGIAI